ncbi:MAG: hypothetical protein LBD99_02355 [Candidatus Margulisbacteria bacterium]|jgi:hypothetical protein|nr:hypothetical protein [Candidatus Margulisiibacteriota bacterium]
MHHIAQTYEYNLYIMHAKQIQVKDNHPAFRRGSLAEQTETFLVLVKSELTRLRIEPNEAREYLRQLVESISRVGCIPPLIASALRDVDGKYQKFTVSRGLTAEQEQELLAKGQPFLAGSNEATPIVNPPPRGQLPPE